MVNRDPDWDIWHSAQAGSEGAYAQLLQAHRCLIRHQLRKRYCGLSDSDLEEVEQDVWVAVWRSLPSFAGRSTFATWLSGLTRNVFLSWLRRRHRREQALLAFMALQNPV